jgi:hypothetical protein
MNLKNIITIVTVLTRVARTLRKSSLNISIVSILKQGLPERSPRGVKA